MREEFKKYLNTIGITTHVLHNRIEEIYEVCSEMCPDEIIDIIVEDYIKEDGTREYEHVNFLSEKYIIGATNFVSTDQFLIAPLKKKVDDYKITKTNYDFKRANEKSRLNLVSTLNDGNVNWSLKASKENCDFLKDIILKYFKPNLRD